MNCSLNEDSRLTISNDILCFSNNLIKLLFNILSLKLILD